MQALQMLLLGTVRSGLHHAVEIQQLKVPDFPILDWIYIWRKHSFKDKWTQVAEFVDFSEPSAVPDCIYLGRITAGQVVH